MSEVKHTPLPCPFCGEQPELVERDKVLVFRCPETSPCFGSGLGTFGKVDLRDQAIEAWNRRAPVNSHGDLVEALRVARTTLSITRTNIMCEMQKGEGTAYRFEGVPEILKQRIDQIDTALSKVLELGEGL